jgi:protein-disulfide isomerase
MKKATGFVLIGATVVGGFLAGRALRDDGGDGDDTAGTPGLAIPGGERKKIPLSGEVKGSNDALVTIIEFSDFQCPFCGRVNPTIDRLMKEYPDKIRVYFKHFPLGFHQDAPLASQAALAAGAQGKFWQMHDKLFANQQSIKRPDLDKYAQELGLDMGRFKQALDSGTFKARVESDTALGSQVGVTGTPAFFINGRSLVGAQPYEKFKEVVDEEIATAQQLLAKGTPRAKLYDTFLASAAAPSAPGAAPPAAPSGPRAPQVSNEVYKVVVGDSVTKGGAAPKVTIVEFSEFQCPFCSRAVPTMNQVLDTYKDDVQLVFKHLPLSFHNNAENAALASEAARQQGKFWEMHDRMFANQQMLDLPSLEKHAQELGLDLAKFKAAMGDAKTKDRLEADKKQAAQFGATGTPTFFVNGRKMVGAQAFEAFKSVIDEEIKKADDKLKAGVARAGLYAALTKDGLDKAAAPPAQAGAPSPDTVFKADIKGAPSKGAKDALITIVEFSDFQCPFCARVEPTMSKVMEEYKGKVRVVWRDFPLPFHQDATPAAIVARVANEQGKFWEMHAKLFENQRKLDRASLEQYAQELGLNAGKVKAALDDKKYESQIKADLEMGQKIGVRGTPAFFINGTFLSGAQPFEAFKARIDQELAKAEALVKKGVARGKLYDAIMKNAQAAAAAAPAAAPPSGGPPEPTPETDQTVFKVAAGNSPSRGPKNAPITVVLYSDFQCPFCSKVEPSLTQLEKDFPGKIRVVWKDFPLGFHQNARPAAMAARAAGDEGKFWQMHSKLFENQRALDRPSLEKYAEELGLDLTKFKAALDSGKYSGEIDADMRSGQTLGVQGTPAAFINGRKISGAYPYDTFKKVVEQELAKMRKRS